MVELQRQMIEVGPEGSSKFEDCLAAICQFVGMEKHVSNFTFSLGIRNPEDQTIYHTQKDSPKQVLDASAHILLHDEYRDYLPMKKVKDIMPRGKNVPLSVRLNIIEKDSVYQEKTGPF